MRLFLSLLAVLACSPIAANEDGRYNWAVLASVSEQVQSESPAYCSGGRVLCIDVFFDVSLRIERVLGSRQDPTPNVVKGTNHYGEDPFRAGNGYRYLFYVHNFRDVPRIGVNLRILKTNDGKYAVPVSELLPYWKESGCEPFVREFRFVAPREWLSWHVGDKEEDWSHEETQLELAYGVRDGDRLVFTKGVLVDDLAIGGKSLRIGCISDMTGDQPLAPSS